MKTEELEDWILKNYRGINVLDSYRERSFFYNPDHSLPRGVYFATIKTSDGPNDKASKLDRSGVFRLSFGIGKKQFENLLGALPKRPVKGQTISMEIDFTALDTLMPHPVYAWIGWVCINNPKSENIKIIKQVLDLSYQLAVAKFVAKK